MTRFLKDLVRDLPGVRTVYLGLVFGLLRRPFLSRRLTIRPLPGVAFDIDYTLGLNGYDTFGDRHNAGYRRWIEACRGQTVVFDVGAHVGLYAVPAGNVVGPSGSVVAFEPATPNVDLLQRHLRYNGLENVTVVKSVVAEEDQQEVPFFESGQADAMNSMQPLRYHERYDRVSRPQRSLDAFCTEHDLWPQVLKIDVEGAEVRVLRGARAMMQSARPLVFLSVHPDRMGLLGDSVEDLQRLIAELGYRAGAFDGSPAEELVFGEYLLVPEG